MREKRLRPRPVPPAVGPADRGGALLELVLGSRAWVHRRVERLALGVDGQSHRFVSVDATVPPQLAIPGSRGRVLFPLGFAQKGPLRAFDITLDQLPLSLLESRSNAQLGQDLLATSADRLFGAALATSAEFVTRCAEVVLADPPRARDAAAHLRRLVEGTVPPADPDTRRFLALAERLAGSFVLVAEVPADRVGTRTVVKYASVDASSSFDLDDLHPRIRWELSDYGFAPSVHFEFRAPPLLRVSALTVATRLPDARPVTVPQPATDELVHLVLRPDHRLQTATVDIAMSPQREGVVTTAAWAASVIAAVLAVAVLARTARGVLLAPVPVAGSSAGAMLAIGGVLLTWVARSPEDRVVNRVLARPRRILWCSAAMVAGSAGLLVLPVVAPVRTWLWWTLFVLQAGVAAAAWIFVRRIRIRGRPQRVLLAGAPGPAAAGPGGTARTDVRSRECTVDARGGSGP